MENKMENKKLYIGLGVLAVAGIAYYMWKKNEGEETSNITAGGGQKKCPCYGVQTPDGSIKYSFACCKKAKQ